MSLKKSLNFLIQAQEAEKSRAISTKRLSEYIKEHSLDVKITSSEITIGKITDEHLKHILELM